MCAPSNDPTNQTIPDIGIVTTDIYDKYAQGFGGTSAASPAVAGTAALIRSADPSLTWRDVKLILAASARKNDSSNTGWETGALKYGSKTDRYHFNHDYGFGVVDAKAAVDLAKTWEPLPLFISETQTSTDTDINVPDTNTAVTSSVTIGSDVQFTEFVELNIAFGLLNRYPRVKNLDIELVSPSGKVSVISPHCPSPRDFGCWLYFITGPYRFGSSKHLGENPAGTWTLRLTDRVSGGTSTQIKSWSLKNPRPRRPQPQHPDHRPDRPGGHRQDHGLLDRTGQHRRGRDILTRHPPHQKRRIRQERRRQLGCREQRRNRQNKRIHGVRVDRRRRIRCASTRCVPQRPRRLVQLGDRHPRPRRRTASPYFAEGDSTVRTVAENTAAGQAVATAVTAVDTDGDTLVYSLSGTDAADFDLASSSGLLQTKSALDFEAESGYTVTISVSDGKNSAGQPDTAIDDTISRGHKHH